MQRSALLLTSWGRFYTWLKIKSRAASLLVGSLISCCKKQLFMVDTVDIYLAYVSENEDWFQ